VSDKLNQLKKKIKGTGTVHNQLIDTNNDYVNDDVNINELSIKTTMKSKRQKFEERYRRDTFWIRNDLKEKLNAQCEGEKGEKTRIINEAIEMYFDSEKRKNFTL
jgi:hypothetical protein